MVVEAGLWEHGDLYIVLLFFNMLENLHSKDVFVVGCC